MQRMCDKGFVWNSSNCECECDKLCDVGEYLDYKNCRKRIIDKLIEECRESIDGNKMLYNKTLDVIPLNIYKKLCSCMVYIVLFLVFLITRIYICCVFIYFYCYLKKDNIGTNFSVG